MPESFRYDAAPMSLDVLILGSGASGLSLALRLAKLGRKVMVVSKSALSSGSTLWAQGGISAVFDEEDSLENHVRDTLIAGAGLCDEAAVRFTVARGPHCIRWLVEQGVQFTEDDIGTESVTAQQGVREVPTQPAPAATVQGKDTVSLADASTTQRLHLTREGGHSHRRVVHAADATGKAVETTLVSLVLNHPSIAVRERCMVIDLITDKAARKSQGAYLFNRANGQVEAVAAKAVALCTGGANQVYLYSSNPFGASGDGIAMAWRAGARVANMEFMQFHPTTLYHTGTRNFLLTEALRGEGGHLRLPTANGEAGERFMPRFDVRAELAPRDVVARAIDHEMKRLGLKHVLLDVTHLDAGFLKSHFPNIYAYCLELGLDITKDPLPVVPSTHFTCGGVVTNLQARTDVDGLYAIGEVACTGLHGANRLASNSLLECLVFAEAAAEDLHACLDARELPPPLPAWDASRVRNSDEDVVVSHNWLELRTFMWDYVGIVRTTKRLERALHRVLLLKDEIADYYGNYTISDHLIELRNLVVCAELIVQSALSRKESRGLHYTLDYPDLAEAAEPTVLCPPGWR